MFISEAGYFLQISKLRLYCIHSSKLEKISQINKGFPSRVFLQGNPLNFSDKKWVSTSEEGMLKSQTLFHVKCYCVLSAYHDAVLACFKKLIAIRVDVAQVAARIDFKDELL